MAWLWSVVSGPWSVSAVAAAGRAASRASLEDESPADRQGFAAWGV